MIERANKTFNTKGERQFDSYQESRIMNLVHGQNGEGVTLAFYDEVALKYFSFQMDFVQLKQSPFENAGVVIAVSGIDSIDTDYEIDGKGHKEKWDSWKDLLKVKAGIKRVVHIPEAVTKEEHWSYLDKEIERCRQGKCRCENRDKGIHYIAG
jgi:hypothetical protein